MELMQLFIQSEAAYECVNALGELGLVQFDDLNSTEDGDHKEDVANFKRKYTEQIRQCEEMQRRLRFFEKEIVKNGLVIGQAGDTISAAAPDSTEMNLMEQEFERLERELKEINANAEALMKQEGELTEMKCILTKTQTFFAEANRAQSLEQGASGADGVKEPLMRSDGRGKLGFIAGTIIRSKSIAFERLIWRACRGNVFVRRVQLVEKLIDMSTAGGGEMVFKDVFIVFYQGSQLETRIKKICDGFQASLYPCPDNNAERTEMTREVDSRLADLQNVLGTTKEHLRNNLSRVAGQIAGWQVKVTKIKSIYHTMNKFDYDDSRKSLLGQCWCPTEQIGNIREALVEGATRSGTGAQPILTPLETKRKPPTFNVTNKFTSAFQGIVDAYGVASYQEVNPTPFTIITFPFLFGVMFGDLGHGFIMFLFAAYLIWKERDLAKITTGGEIWNTIFGGRYIVVLMGAFSMYTGFIYNDCFAKSITWIDSGWRMPLAAEVENTDSFYISSKRCDDPDPNIDQAFKDKNGCFEYAYPFGLDPVWMMSENKLTFSNSFKMKMSVVLGVMQMGFGVTLGFFNGRFFKEPLDYIHQFVPQILFLMLIFGYLVLMIFYKWATAEFPTGNPPSLLLMLINMFLKMGSPIEDGEVLYGDKDGKAQQTIQTILVAVALICVPWMLLVKPLALKGRMEKAAAAKAARGGNDDDDDDHDEAHGFGEVMVHQSIHTIEFCLGCISNTASYLRLWALSLAHAELSEVLWEMILHNCFHMNPFILFCGFAVWAVLTIAVLLIMEGLSAFLHALRLHWVEFQNKFYEGEGYLFHPFDFRLIIEGGEEDMN